MVLKSLFVSIFVNLCIYNKLENKLNYQVLNTPFLNLVYLFMGFYYKFLLNLQEEFDKGEFILFPRDYYNIVETKDEKFIAMGNLEEKFQENFKKVFFKEIVQSRDDETFKEKVNFDNLTIDQISHYMKMHNRDDIFKKVILKLE